MTSLAQHKKTLSDISVNLKEMKSQIQIHNLHKILKKALLTSSVAGKLAQSVGCLKVEPSSDTRRLCLAFVELKSLV